MAYQAVEEIQVRCEKENIPFWKAVQLEDCGENGITEEDSWQQMTLMWNRMKESVDAYNPSERSRSGLVGKEGGLMDEYRQNEKPLCGDFVSKVIANALKMGCNNACMKRIVAAPTAGACGVMPAVLVTYCREYGIEEDRMIEAMYVAAGIGQVIASRASLAGASGGCQAEADHRADAGSGIQSLQNLFLGGAAHLVQRHQYRRQYTAGACGWCRHDLPHAGVGLAHFDCLFHDKPNVFSRNIFSCRIIAMQFFAVAARK